MRYYRDSITNRQCESTGGSINRSRIENQLHVQGVLSEGKVAYKHLPWIQDPSNHNSYGIFICCVFECGGKIPRCPNWPKLMKHCEIYTSHDRINSSCGQIIPNMHQHSHKKLILTPSWYYKQLIRKEYLPIILFTSKLYTILKVISNQK